LICIGTEGLLEVLKKLTTIARKLFYSRHLLLIEPATFPKRQSPFSSGSYTYYNLIKYVPTLPCRAVFAGYFGEIFFRGERPT
ncbi:MAG: hypothetical protein JXB42_07650, partial [Deltaproteobacteria bacterium]|nr:hypothetical protein [Deltaproteobacteria bacterium]